MRILVQRWENSPALVRVMPFGVLAGLTALQGRVGPGSEFWVYGLKTSAGLALVWAMRPRVAEMRWAWSWEAAAVGAAVFGLWVGLDGIYPQMAAAGPAWNPHAQFGEGAWLAWAFVGIRLTGSVAMVPLLEEVFYRSFLYRWLHRADFASVPLGAFRWMPFLVTSAVFGLAHREWLPGILCGAAYQWLVCRKGRLGDAIAAHAVTNLLLGLWVVGKGAWRFW